MFGWFKRKPEGLYTPKEREIFRFWNGSQWVDGDPMIIHRRLMEVVGDFTAYCQAASSPLKDGPKALCRAVEMIRGFFDIKPLNGIDATGTLSNEQCVDLFVTYREWQASVKKNLKSTPTPVKATLEASASSLAADSPMSNTSASGSTAGDSSTGMPDQSPTAPASPLAASPPTVAISTP